MLSLINWIRDYHFNADNTASHQAKLSLLALLERIHNLIAHHSHSFTQQTNARLTENNVSPTLQEAKCCPGNTFRKNFYFQAMF